MYKGKRLACVVLNYNDAEQTNDFIMSIVAFNYLDNIIVVDNCSTDQSFYKLEKNRSDRITVVRTEKNGGYGYGNNFGVEIAVKQFKSDYVIISNPDVRFEEILICKIVEAFLENDKAAIVSAVQVNGFTDDEISNCCWRVPSYWDYLSSSLLFAGRIKNHGYDLDKNKSMEEVGCVPGAFLVVDGKKFMTIHGYDERIFLYCEESALGFRVKEANYKTILLTHENYFHYHSTSIKKSIKKELTRHKMVLKSRMFYIENYLKASPLKQIFASFVFKVSIIEYALLYHIKRFKLKGF